VRRRVELIVFGVRSGAEDDQDVRHSCPADPTLGSPSSKALLAQLCERGRTLVEVLEPHAPQHRRGLRELDLAVLDDLKAVPPRVAKVEEAARENLRTRLLESSSNGLLVVDDETEVTGLVGRLRSAFRESDELIAHIDERHPSEPLADLRLEVEDPGVEGERLADVADLERDVIDPD
jgi:hypothetical protein